MKLYVGTYAKYNEGSIFGEWVDLNDYSNKDDFIEYCEKLHNDESDPEFMFQDYEYEEDWEESFYNESFISEEYWNIKDLTDEIGDSFKYICLYLDQHGEELTADNVRDNQDRFYGIYDSPADYMESFYEETGTEIPDSLRNYINWEDMARDEELSGYIDFIELDEMSDYGFNHKVAVFTNC